MSSIELPVLVLHARDDSAIPHATGQEVAAAFPGAELVSLDEGGSRRILGAPQALQALQALRDFLAPILA